MRMSFKVSTTLWRLSLAYEAPQANRAGRSGTQCEPLCTAPPNPGQISLISDSKKVGSDHRLQESRIRSKWPSNGCHSIRARHHARGHLRSTHTRARRANQSARRQGQRTRNPRRQLTRPAHQRPRPRRDPPKSPRRAGRRRTHARQGHPPRTHRRNPHRRPRRDRTNLPCARGSTTVRVDGAYRDRTGDFLLANSSRGPLERCRFGGFLSVVTARSIGPRFRQFAGFFGGLGPKIGLWSNWIGSSANRVVQISGGLLIKSQRSPTGDDCGRGS
jgi:hypothetical protein